MKYFVKIKPGTEELLNLSNLINFKDLKNLEIARDYINKLLTVYTVGILTPGWQFLFEAHKVEDYNNKTYFNLWDNTLSSIEHFLKDSNTIIFDENNKIYTFDEFWSIIKPSLYRDKNHINLLDYCKKTQDEYINLTENVEFISKEGLRFSYIKLK